MGLFGGGNSSSQTKNFIDNSVETTNKTDTKGSQASDGAISGVSSNIKVNNNTSSFSQVLDGGAIDAAANQTIKTVELSAKKDQAVISSLGSSVDKITGALAGMFKGALSTVESANKQAFSFAGESGQKLAAAASDNSKSAFTLANSAKAPDAALAKTTIYGISGVAGLAMLAAGVSYWRKNK